MVDRVSEAIGPHHTAIGEVARTSAVNYIDETSWLLHGTRQWLWVMAHPVVASFQIHPNRSKAAFVQLIGDWTGILVSDGYGVYHSGLHLYSIQNKSRVIGLSHRSCLCAPTQTIYVSGWCRLTRIMRAQCGS